MERLQICINCNSDLVYPFNWEDVADSRWWIELRCPECEYVREGTFYQIEVENFDRFLDRATDKIADDLLAVERTNMSESLELFVQALANDHILPVDF